MNGATGEPEPYQSPLRDKAFSLYLDLWRSFAALVVVMAHLRQDGFQLPITFAGKFAHEAVIVFFVLSGLVIAHSTLSNARGWREYLAARAGRLFAVIVPATLLGIACAAVIGPGEWSDRIVSRAEWSPAEILLGWTFLSRSWLIDADLPLNEPFWSLCYEAWYYTLFGVFLFMRGKARIAALCAGAMIAGPAILILSPAWLAGVWLYRRATSVTVPMPRLVAIGCIAAIAAIGFSGLPPLLRATMSGIVPEWYVLRDATNVFTDLAIALLFSLHLLAARTLVPAGILRFERHVRFAAGGTFTLYLMHRPLTYLLSGDGFAVLHGPLMSLATLIGIVTFALLLSRSLERNLTDWLRRRILAALGSPQGAIAR